ncbi:Replication protein A 70 kDa DNA-binding subunit E [Bienertia sinuspersici]
MAQSINMINDLIPINEIWKIKVRIILLWGVPNYNNPNVVDSIELVLVDEKGSRIQASIRKTIMQQFSNMEKEGGVTVVRECEDVQLPLHGLNFTSFAQILMNEIDDSLLVDVIGEVIAIGDLMDVSKDSKPNYKLAIELDDLEYQKHFKMHFMGNYAEEMSKYVNEDGRRIVILQFVKIKVWKGENGGGVI